MYNKPLLQVKLVHELDSVTEYFLASCNCNFSLYKTCVISTIYCAEERKDTYIFGDCFQHSEPDRHKTSNILIV